MRLDKLSKIIYEEGTASANRKITVKNQQNHILWEGKAKDLITYADGTNWLVLEVLVDLGTSNDVVDYNRGKIIIVY